MLSAPRGPLRGCRKQNLPSRKAVRIVCVETGLALRRRAEEAEMGFPTACVTQGSSNKAPGSFGVHQGPRGAFGEPKKWQERWSSRSPMRHQKSSTPHLLHGDFCIKFHSKVSRSEQDILADECPGSSEDKDTGACSGDGGRDGSAGPARSRPCPLGSASSQATGHLGITLITSRHALELRSFSLPGPQHLLSPVIHFISPSSWHTVFSVAGSFRQGALVLIL